MKITTTIFRFFLLTGFFPLLVIAQTQIGDDIDGITSNIFSGYSVALSADGSIVAIGSRGSYSFKGHVQVFQKVSGVWTQVGNNIIGQSTNDNSGFSVSLSADGSIVAIGAIHNLGNGIDSGYVRVYKNTGGSWVQIGTNITGEATNDFFGTSISLSADGNIVAVGAIYNDGNGNNSGHVRIYQNNAGVWEQMGVDLDGLQVNEAFGYSVSMSSDGSIVAIGAPLSSINGNYRGQVRIFKFNTGVWEQIGGNINGEGSGQSGTSVSLSSDGSIVAIGAPFDSGNGTGAGHVRVYKNNAGVWEQLGTDIDGISPDGLGQTVSLSSDGTMLASGAIYNATNGTNSGHVQLYKNIGGTWTQFGVDINGESIYDKSGQGLSLSADGNTVAIGAQFNKGNGTNAGHVRVFDLTNILGSNNFEYSKLKIYPNPTTSLLHIETSLNESFNASIINQLGQEVIKKIDLNNNKTIDVSQLSKGLYFLKTTNSGGNNQTIKFIKN